MTNKLSLVFLIMVSCRAFAADPAWLRMTEMDNGDQADIHYNLQDLLSYPDKYYNAVYEARLRYHKGIQAGLQVDPSFKEFIENDEGNGDAPKAVFFAANAEANRAETQVAKALPMFTAMQKISFVNLLDDSIDRLNHLAQLKYKEWQQAASKFFPEALNDTCDFDDWYSKDGMGYNIAGGCLRQLRARTNTSSFGDRHEFSRAGALNGPGGLGSSGRSATPL